MGMCHLRVDKPFRGYTIDPPQLNELNLPMYPMFPVIVKLCCTLQAMLYPQNLSTFHLTPLNGTWPYDYA